MKLSEIRISGIGDWRQLTDKIDYIQRTADLSKILEKIEELSKELADRGKKETVWKDLYISMKKNLESISKLTDIEEIKWNLIKFMDSARAEIVKRILNKIKKEEISWKDTYDNMNMLVNILHITFDFPESCQ